MELKSIECGVCREGFRGHTFAKVIFLAHGWADFEIPVYVPLTHQSITGDTIQTYGEDRIVQIARCYLSTLLGDLAQQISGWKLPAEQMQFDNRPSDWSEPK